LLGLWIRISDPRFWFFLYPYDEDWDKLVQEAITDNQIDLYDLPFCVTVAGYETWITNYPIVYGVAHSDKKNRLVRPSVATIHKLKGKIDALSV
jgi:hypothetical protein